MSKLASFEEKNLINTTHECDVLVCGVERENEAFIPGGDFVLKGGDLVSIVATFHNCSEFFKKIGITLFLRKFIRSCSHGRKILFFFFLSISFTFSGFSAERTSSFNLEFGKSFPV